MEPRAARVAAVSHVENGLTGKRLLPAFRSRAVPRYRKDVLLRILCLILGLEAPERICEVADRDEHGPSESHQREGDTVPKEGTLEG